MEFILDLIAQNYIPLNIVFFITFTLMVGLFILSMVAPHGRIAKVFPLMIMFNPKENLDLEFQSIGYTMMHTSWLAKISHYTIFIDALLWFVLLTSVHWSLSVVLLVAMIYQGIKIKEKSFIFSFFTLGAIYFIASFLIVNSLNGMVEFSSIMTSPAWLFSIVVLMLGGIIRFFGHVTEPAPPTLLENSDQFVKISIKTANWKLAVMPFYGYIAEFSSGLPTRLFTVQVSYLNQLFFKMMPSKTMTKKEITLHAKDIVKKGYKANSRLNNYYQLVAGKK